MKYCDFNGCTEKIVKGKYCKAHKTSRKAIKKKDIYHHDNKSFYNTDAWKAVRADVYEREMGKCQRCTRHVYGRSAHCHHIVPIKKNKLLKLEINNVMLLCPQCHVIVENEEKTKKVFASYF